MFAVKVADVGQEAPELEGGAMAQSQGFQVGFLQLHFGAAVMVGNSDAGAAVKAVVNVGA